MTTMLDTTTALVDTTKDSIRTGLDVIADTTDGLVRTTGAAAGDVFDTAVAATTPLSAAVATAVRVRWRRRLLVLAAFAVIAAAVAALVAKRRTDSGDATDDGDHETPTAGSTDHRHLRTAAG